MKKESVIEQLTGILRNGEKSAGEVKLGVEIEHLVVRQDSFQSVTYYEADGIETILKKLAEKGYQRKYEGKYLVGLTKEEMDITLEPGGQLEFSTRPCLHLAHINEVYQRFLDDVLPIIQEQKQYLLGVGYHPQTRIKEIPFNPKKRYEYMSNYLSKTGKYALNMMKGTASVQVAVDYTSEEDFIKKFRLANFLTPLFYLMTDNAPVFEGEVYDAFSLRTLIWENTDPGRSGIVKGALDKAFGYRDYAEYLLHSEPICVLENGDLKPVQQQTLWQVYQDKAGLSEEELEHLFTMVFPDVRGKRYIEIRMADSMPRELTMAYLALIKGLFYDKENVDALYALSLDFNDQTIKRIKETIIRQGYQTPFGESDLGAFGEKVLYRAEKALDEEEKGLLKPIKQLVLKRETFGQQIKRGYREKGLKGLLDLQVTRHI